MTEYFPNTNDRYGPWDYICNKPLADCVQHRGYTTKDQCDHGVAYRTLNPCVECTVVEE